MFIARWSVDLKFGHKDEALALMKKWETEVGAKSGFDPAKRRLLTGSIGALESRLESEMEVESLAALEKGFAEMAKHPYQKQFGKDLEAHIVSGTNRWEIFRVAS